MDVQTTVNNIQATDKDVQNEAYAALIEATDQPVDWAYEVWDQMLADLRHKDNHVRAIAAQVLSNLAKSDPDQRMLKDLDALVAITKDERFVTARHALQSLWKIGVVGKPQQDKLVDALKHRFDECAVEKNCTLIRYDILQSLRNVYDQTKDDTIQQTALALIDTEPDAKYRKKYATLWKKT